MNRIAQHSNRRTRRAMRQIPEMKPYVPFTEKDKLYEKNLSAVRENGLALKHIPREERTKGLMLSAVRQNGNAIAFIPQEDRTRRIMLEAVRNDGWAIRYIPEEYRTPEMIRLAGRN